MQTHFCRLLITGDGDAHNPVSGQASVKAEDELSKYVVARCCARMQIVLSLKSKRPPTKQISYEETVVCIVMLSYSNKTHIQYVKNTIDKEKRPGGSDIEAIRLLKEDFISRGVDKNLILDVGEDHVILSSEHKIRLGAKITLGLVDEPVSLDGCESVASNYTEL